MEKKDKKKREPRPAFVVPTIEEVSDCMFEYTKRKKMNWPKAFCDWYAEKFWNSYEKSGWKLSAGRGGPVKDWRACFKSEWVTLKYSGDIAMLDRLTPKPKPVDKATLDYMNDILDSYRKSPETFTEETLSSCYFWLKENGFLKLQGKQREKAIEDSRISLMKGQATAVRFFMDHMVKELLTFDYFFNEKT